MARRNNGHRDDEIGDIYDKDPWWLDKLGGKGKAKAEETPTPTQHPFRLSCHHVLCYDGYQKRLIVKDDPGLRSGFAVLCSPGGLPVARLHGDLGENEVSWVLR
jgi:hypothetical protein